MNSARRNGRMLGLLLPLHLAIGLIVPYVLLLSITGAPAAFLVEAAEIATRVRLSVGLLFLGGVIPVAITATAWPILGERGRALGQWLLALAAVNLCLQVVENQHWLTMLSVSEEFTRASVADSEQWQALGTTVRSAWKWAHYTHLLAAVGWILLFCVALYRLAIVPRALAAFGVLTASLHIIGVTLPVLLDYRLPFGMELYGMPLGVAYLVLAFWLAVRGVAERPAAV